MYAGSLEPFLFSVISAPAKERGVSAASAVDSPEFLRTTWPRKSADAEAA